MVLHRTVVAFLVLGNFALAAEIPTVTRQKDSRNLRAVVSISGYVNNQAVSGTNNGFTCGASISEIGGTTVTNPWNRWWMTRLTCTIGGTTVAEWDAATPPDPSVRGKSYSVVWATNRFADGSTVPITAHAEFYVERGHMAPDGQGGMKWVVDESGVISTGGNEADPDLTVFVKTHNRLVFWRSIYTSTGSAWPTADADNISKLVSTIKNRFVVANYTALNGTQSTLHKSEIIDHLPSATAVGAVCHGAPEGLLDSWGYLPSQTTRFLPWQTIGTSRQGADRIPASWEVIYACDTLPNDAANPSPSFNNWLVDAVYLGFAFDLKPWAMDQQTGTPVSLENHANVLFQKLLAGHPVYRAVSDANNRYAPLSTENTQSLMVSRGDPLTTLRSVYLRSDLRPLYENKDGTWTDWFVSFLLEPSQS